MCHPRYGKHRLMPTHDTHVAVWRMRETLQTSLFSKVYTYHASYLGFASRAMDSAPRAVLVPGATKAACVRRVRLLFPLLLFPTPAFATGSCCPCARKALHAEGLKISSTTTTKKWDMDRISRTGSKRKVECASKHLGQNSIGVTPSTKCTYQGKREINCVAPVDLFVGGSGS